MHARLTVAIQALIAVAVALGITSSLCRAAETESRFDCSRLSRWRYVRIYEQCIFDMCSKRLD